MCSRDVHDKKAAEPMLVRLSGKETQVTCTHDSNAHSPIASNPMQTIDVIGVSSSFHSISLFNVPVPETISVPSASRVHVVSSP